MHKIGLAYDPVQIGWVVAGCVDDIDEHDPDTAGPAFKPRALAPTYRFRPWSQTDLPVYRALLDDPAVWAMMYEPYPDPLDDDLARQLIDLSNSDHHEVLAVLRDGQIVGQVRMLFDAGTSAEFSYWFGRAYWGKGLGSAILAIHSGRTFVQHPDLTSIFAVVHPDNAASRQALRKAGYVEEGPDSRRPGWISYRLTRARAEAINSGSDPI
jgi:RimJ/RimL family protein N-acetyltransferase